MITNTEIEHTYDLVSQEFRRQNLRCKFPKNTDRTKTYQWRYLRSLTAKFREWKFDDATCLEYIKLVIQYTRQESRYCTLAIFHKTNMLQRCYDMLTARMADTEKLVDMLESTHAWLMRLSLARPLYELLIEQKVGQTPNIIIWYEANRLSLEYIALSKECMRAINVIEQTGKSDRLPSRTALLAIRQQLLCNEKYHHRLQAIINGV